MAILHDIFATPIKKGRLRADTLINPEPGRERYAGLFDPGKHPRGQPKNRGQFVRKQGIGLLGTPVAAPAAPTAGLPAPVPAMAPVPSQGPPVKPKGTLPPRDTDYGPRSSDPMVDWAVRGVKSRAFKAWFGPWDTDPANASKAINPATGEPDETSPYSWVRSPDGKPLIVYHGTTHDFEAFEDARGNPDNHLGIGHYFTSDLEDAEANYAGTHGELGGDLQGRIDERAEAIREAMYEFTGDPNEVEDWAKHWGVDIDAWNKAGDDDQEQDYLIRDAAHKAMHGEKQQVLPCYLNIRNPVVLDGHKGTQFEYEYPPHPDDPEELDYDNPQGSGVRLMEAMRQVAREGGYSQFGNPVNVGGILGNAGLDDGVSAEKLLDFMKQDYDANEIGRETDDGFKTQPGQFMNDVFRKLGHDGVVYTDAHRFWPRLVEPGTRHYIAFHPTQIKSVDNRGTFDPNDPRIKYAFGQWNEQLHPRGQPENKGEFAPKPGGQLGNIAEMPQVPMQPQVPIQPQPPYQPPTPDEEREAYENAPPGFYDDEEGNPYDEEGYGPDGYDRDGFNRGGYDRENYDARGFGQDGFDRNGFDVHGYDPAGYDVNGINREGFGEDGYDVNGYDVDGFDQSGYSSLGFDRQGFDKEGVPRNPDMNYVADTFSKVLNRNVKKDHVIRAMGLDPSNVSYLNVEVKKFKKNYGINISGAINDDDGNPIGQVNRTFLLDSGGLHGIKNNVMKLAKEHQGKGEGPKALATQVEQAMDLGFSYLECYAYRRDDPADKYIGYSYWPEMGYDGDIPFQIRRNLPSQFSGSMSVRDIIEKPGGKDWWRKHGDSFNATFMLSREDPSVDILNERLKAKGIDPV